MFASKGLPMLQFIPSRILLAAGLWFTLIQTSQVEAQNSLDTALYQQISDETRRLLRTDLDKAKKNIDRLMEITAPDSMGRYRAVVYIHDGRYFKDKGLIDTALDRYKKAEEIYALRKDTLDLARMKGRTGMLLFNQGNGPKAIATLKEALPLFSELKDTLSWGITYQNIGRIHKDLGDINTALDYLFKSEKLFLEQKNTKKLITTYSTLAAIYSEAEKQEKSLIYYKKALDISTEVKDTLNISHNLDNLGSAYLTLKQYEKAESLILEAERLISKIGNVRFIMNNARTLARLYDLKPDRDPERALEYAEKAYGIAKKYNSRIDLMIISIRLARLYRELGQEAKGQKVLEEALPIAENEKTLQSIIDIALPLSDIYEQQGRYQLALKHFKRATEIQRSLVNQEKIEEFKELELNHEFDQERLADSLATLQEKQKLELTHQEELAEEQQSRNRLTLILSLIGITAIFGLLAFWRQRRQTRLLNVKNQQIEETLHEKQLLLKEVHHRVKNNFQIISSLLELQSRGIEDEKALELAQEGKNRVKSMAMIHQRLYQNDDLLIYFDDYINKLVEEISAMYGSDEKARVTIQVPKYSFDIDTAIPLGLIVNELVTNAFKYGFDDENQELQVALDKEGEEEYKLTVTDNGKGIPEGLDISKAKSLGLRLVRRLSKQLQGNLTYSGLEGCSFIVRFKDTAARALVD